MANNLIEGNNGVVALPAADGVTFVDAGFTVDNCAIIFEVGNPNKSWKPGRPGNAITAFVGKKGYYIIMKSGLDKSALLYPDLTVTATTAYRFNGAAQNITVGNPADFVITATTPFWMAFRGKLTAAGAAFRFGRYNGSARVWDVNFKHEAGIVQADFQFTDSTDSTQFLFSSTLDTPLNLNQEYLIFITGDGILGNHAAILVDNANRTSGENTTNTNVQALASAGSFTVGQFLTFPSNNANVRDLVFGIGNQLNGTQATELYNGGVRKDITTMSFYGSKVTAYYKLASDLVDSKGPHNGTATTPTFV